jgi:hypothetical protein
VRASQREDAETCSRALNGRVKAVEHSLIESVMGIFVTDVVLRKKRDWVQRWLTTILDTAVTSSYVRWLASLAAAAMCIIAVEPSLIAGADFFQLRSPEWSSTQ